MTSGADDALFGQDGTTPGGYEPAGKPRAPAPPAASADAHPRASIPAVERPAAAPGWLTGESAPPWPPRGPSTSPAGPPVPPAHPVRPTQPARSGAPAGPPTRPVPVPGPPPRPRVVEDPGILGLSRLTRGRFGSRVFTWFFVLVFMLIAAQMVASIVSIVDPW